MRRRGLDPTLAPTVRRLQDFERARPRYAGADAAPLHALVPDPSLYPGRRVPPRAEPRARRRGAELLRYGGPQGHAGLREALAGRLRETGAQVTADDDRAHAGRDGGHRARAAPLRRAGRRGRRRGADLPQRARHADRARLRSRCRSRCATARPTSACSSARSTRPDVQALLHDADVPQPARHVDAGRAPPRAARARGARRRAGVEDAYEMDLRYAGRPVPPLAALDRAGLVVQLFSFSKSLFPGARVGRDPARGRLVDALLALKHATDLGGALAFQAALARLRRRRRLRPPPDAPAQASCSAPRRAARRARARAAGGARWTEPEGGHQVWVELPGGVDTRDLLPEAARAGVLFAPGSQFHHDGRPSSGLRLSIAAADEATIRRGVAALGAVGARATARAAGARRAPRAIHV